MIKDIKILKELRDLLPCQTDEEREALKSDLLEWGYFRDKVIVWQEENACLDGHNRIDLYLNDPDVGSLPEPEIAYVSLPDIEEAKYKVDCIQLGRRNLRQVDRENAMARVFRHKKDRLSKTSRGDKSRQIDAIENSTPVETEPRRVAAKEVAEEFGTSASTVERSDRKLTAEEKIAEVVGEELARKYREAVTQDLLPKTSKLEPDTIKLTVKNALASRSKKGEKKPKPKDTPKSLMTAISKKTGEVRRRWDDFVRLGELKTKGKNGTILFHEAKPHIEAFHKIVAEWEKLL